MMSQLKVSVIILTYNNLQYIKRAIDSILIQSYSNIEVIIQDDASDKFDKELITKCFLGHENKFTNIVISRNEENLGTVKNYNEAIKNATGDIIAPLSCDDEYIDSNVIADIVNIFTQTQCEVCCAFGKGALTEKIVPNPEFVQSFQKSSQSERIARILYGDWYMFGAATYYRKSYLEKVGGFDNRFVLIEDYPSNIKMVLNNVNISFADRIAISYGESGVSSKKNKMRNSIIKDDLRKIYEEFILTNIEGVLTNKQKRAVYFSYERLANGMRGVICYFKYIDIVFWKIKKRIWSSILNKEIDEFNAFLDK